MKYLISTIAMVGVALAASSTAIAQDKPQIAFIVNGPADFWKTMEAGVSKAKKELPNYDIKFIYPERADAAIQLRLIDDLIASGVDAIAVAVVDPATSTESLNRIAKQVPLFTFDSDAPQADRLFYIGSSNYELGKQLGEVAKATLAEGTKCQGFVGLTGAENFTERKRGFEEAVAGTGIEIVDVRGDDIDMTRARANVDDVLVAHPEIKCFVGFYGYSTPSIYEALSDAGKLGEIQVLGFDEHPTTLGAVKDGSVIATVVQQSFEWGVEGSHMIAKYLEGDKSVVPANGLVIIPGITLTKGNVEQFQADFVAKLKSAE